MIRTQYSRRSWHRHRSNHRRPSRNHRCCYHHRRNCRNTCIRTSTSTGETDQRVMGVFFQSNYNISLPISDPSTLLAVVCERIDAVISTGYVGAVQAIAVVTEVELGVLMKAKQQRRLLVQFESCRSKLRGAKCLNGICVCVCTLPELPQQSPPSQSQL